MKVCDTNLSSLTLGKCLMRSMLIKNVPSLKDMQAVLHSKQDQALDD